MAEVAVHTPTASHRRDGGTLRTFDPHLDVPVQPHPGLNALASIMLASSLLAVALGTLVYRRLTRGERHQESTVEGFAAQV